MNKKYLKEDKNDVSRMENEGKAYAHFLFREQNIPFKDCKNPEKLIDSMEELFENKFSEDENENEIAIEAAKNEFIELCKAKTGDI